MPLPPPELLASPWQPCEQCGAMVLADTGTRCPRCGFRPRRSGLIVNAGGFPPVFGPVFSGAAAGDAVDRVLIPGVSTQPGDLVVALIAVSPAGFQAAGIFVGTLGVTYYPVALFGDATYDVGLFMARETSAQSNVTATCDTDIQGAYNIAACVTVLRGMRKTGTVDFDKLAHAGGTSTAPDSGLTAATTFATVALAAVLTEGPDTDDAGSWTNGSLGLARSTGSVNGTLALAWQPATVPTAYRASKTGVTSRPWLAGAYTLLSAP